jgi:hypothetical protein
LQTASGLLNTCASVRPAAPATLLRAFATLSRNCGSTCLADIEQMTPKYGVLFIVRYPYKIFYRVRVTVEILHIRHPSRRENR